MNEYSCMKAIGQTITLVFMLIFFTSCDADKPKIGNSEYTIIAYDKQQLNYLFENAKPSQLDEEDIVFIETLIKKTVSDIEIEHGKSIDNSRNLDPNEKKDLQTYQRQYVVVIDKNGQKLVWINFFCENFFPDTWKTEIINVFDGGACFFNLKVNLTTKRVFDVHVNGLANLPISTLSKSTAIASSKGQF